MFSERSISLLHGFDDESDVNVARVTFNSDLMQLSWQVSFRHLQLCPLRPNHSYDKGKKLLVPAITCNKLELIQKWRFCYKFKSDKKTNYSFKSTHKTMCYFPSLQFFSGEVRLCRSPWLQNKKRWCMRKPRKLHEIVARNQCCTQLILKQRDKRRKRANKERTEWKMELRG